MLIQRSPQAKATAQITHFNRKELTMHATSIVNGVDLDRLSGTIDAVAANPRWRGFSSVPATTGSTAYWPLAHPWSVFAFC